MRGVGPAPAGSSSQRDSLLARALLVDLRNSETTNTLGSHDLFVIHTDHGMRGRRQTADHALGTAYPWRIRV